jgi:protein ImuB
MDVIPGGGPSRLRRAGQEYAVIRWWGPERIETGWWRGQDIHRDYYIVETECGTRWWLFRRRDDGRWFLHGCFD